MKILWFSVFDPISGLIWPVLNLYGTRKIQCQNKYVLSVLLKLDFKVVNHLVKFLGFSDVIYWRYCDFVVFPHFRSNLTCFGRLWYPKAPILDQICLLWIVWPRFQGCKSFSEVSGRQWRHILKILWFYCFYTISCLIWPVLDIYGILKLQY